MINENDGFSVGAVYRVDPASVDTEKVAKHLLDLLEGRGASVTTLPNEIGVRITVDESALEDAMGEGYRVILAAFADAGLVDPVGLEFNAIEHGRLHAELWAQADELLGVAEVADLLGVTKQRASELQTRKGFPQPAADLASGPVWWKSTLLRFVETWSRKPGRPKKEVPPMKRLMPTVFKDAST